MIISIRRDVIRAFLSILILSFLITMAPVKSYAGRDGEIRITYINTLHYGSFSDMVKENLKKTGFDPKRHECILVKILASVKRKYYNSACYNVTSNFDDPCIAGSNIIYVVSKKDWHIFKREKYVDIRTIFLFKDAVYGQSIPQGIYNFLTDYQGKEK